MRRLTERNEMCGAAPFSVDNFLSSLLDPACINLTPTARSAAAGGSEDASQSHAERFDLEFKPFTHFRETALRPIDA
jgi:hypothetical protein